MRRALTLILGVALFGILAAVVVASQGADDPAGTTNTVTETVEHTKTVKEKSKRARHHDRAAKGADVSGPCDEAEHATDPRCAGQPSTGSQGDDEQNQVDNSGPGSTNSGQGDDGEVDEHGDRGEVESGDDRGDDNEVESGDDRGGHDEIDSGDDHGGDDNSGHGGGGDDD